MTILFAELDPSRAGPSDLVAGLWRYRLLIAAITLATVLAGIVYLHLATYRYTAEMRVIASHTPANAGSLSPGGKLGGLASLVGVSVDGESTSPFHLYLEELTSRDTAAELARRPAILHAIFDRQWDASAARWRVPETPFRDGLKAILGFPPTPWRAPDAARMQDYLRENIKVDEDPKRAVTVVRFDHEDPRFAVTLLTALNTIVDRHLRDVALQRASEYARYLDARLQTVTVAEHRLALTEALSEQEKQVMFASSAAPYAADPVELSVASIAPTSPRPVIVLVSSVIIGAVLGALAVMVILYVRTRYREPGTASRMIAP